jgi:hypothetical protein
MTYFSKYAILVTLISPFSMANTLLDELSKCAANNDSLQRLVCYDTLAEKTKNSLPKQHNLQNQVPLQVDKTKQASVNVADPSLQQQTKFGYENKQPTEDLIKQIKATITNIRKAPRGQLIITLDNGQVWRQTDSMHFKLSKEEVVLISRGAMGSFFIGKENRNKRIRAKRVN